MPGTPPVHPHRTTVLVGAVLAVVLALGAWVAAGSGSGPTGPTGPTGSAVSASPAAPPTRSSPRVKSTPSPSAPPTAPRAGRAYPVRRVGSLTDRSRIVTGHGNADVRSRVAAGSGIRVHFICTGCDADTWVLDGRQDGSSGPQPLDDPSDATWAVGSGAGGGGAGAPGAAGRPGVLLVKAPAEADWALTLTPFDAVPVHGQTFDGLDDDVVAVRTTGEVRLRCPGPLATRTFTRGPGAGSYETGDVRLSAAGEAVVAAATTGTDLLVVVEVGCAGRWTLSVP